MVRVREEVEVLKKMVPRAGGTRHGRACCHLAVGPDKVGL